MDGSIPSQAAKGFGKGTGTVWEDSGGVDASKRSFKRCNRKKALGPAEKRELVGYARETFQMSLR